MKKIVRKARQQLMKNLLKHLWLDPTDTDTTALPLGRLNSTLGKREEMGEYYAFLCELLKSTSGFHIDEKYIAFFSFFNTFYRYWLLCPICSPGDIGVRHTVVTEVMVLL